MANTKNQQPYFPHSANSRNEDKMIRLRMRHGVLGYGIYYMLLERLRMADDYRGELDFEILSWDLDCDAELIHSVIYDFGLFDIVEDGTKFQSVELSAYMEFMEEKKRKRAEAARAAAYARWGKTLPEADKQPEPAGVSVEKKQKSGVEKKYTLEEEFKIMQNDNVWLEAICRQTNMTKEEVLASFPAFRDNCISRAKGEGHKNLADALQHFHSWIMQRVEDRQPYKKEDMKKISESRRESLRRENMDKEIKDREGKFEERQKQKVNPADYIRNKGYDPAVVTMVKLMQPHWQEENPPTHPEWIGQFCNKPEEAETAV